MTATRDQIVYQFLEKRFSEWTQANWGLHEDADYWDIGPDTGTYINGVPLIVDLDFYMGYMLEIVEKESSTVSYMVIVTGPGGHDSFWYDGEVGTFFDRSIDVFEAMKWGLSKIEGLLEAMNEVS